MTDNVFNAGGAGAPQGPQPGREPGRGKPPESAEFRRLLEKLEELSARREPRPVEDADDLREALRRAEDDFQSVMDLRRALEDAYRKQEP